ncbi:MAG: hypothetical protein FD180_1037 [Planctomycetota bacterium]|nr:MAG: hypothetical protein FD180_1037 [Planctomycetota bacterium]
MRHQPPADHRGHRERLFSLCFLWLPLAFAFAASVFADDSSDLADRLKKLQFEEATRRLPLAEHCEKCKMWKEANAEYARLIELAPDNLTVKEKAKKAAEMAEISQARPAKGEQEVYRAGQAALGKDMSKKYWELAIWAAGKGLREEAERIAGMAERLDEGMGIGEAPQSKKFYEALYPDGDERKKAVDALNEYRKKCGLPPCVFSATVSAGAQRHSEYLVKNEGHPSTEGLGAHNEDPALPGYTPEGQRAGGASDIGQVPPVASMINMLGTFYHRIPLLSPHLKKVGIGWATKPGATDLGWCVIDCGTGVGPRNDKLLQLVAYPAPGATDVQRAFDDELPDPIPAGEDHKNGEAITLSWFGEGQITGGEMEVKVNGTAVEGYFTTRQKPARKDHGNGNSLCFIPKEVLPPNAKVEVNAKTTLEGKPLAKSWSFTTGTHEHDAWRK